MTPEFQIPDANMERLKASCGLLVRRLWVIGALFVSLGYVGFLFSYRAEGLSWLSTSLFSVGNLGLGFMAIGAYLGRQVRVCTGKEVDVF